MRRFSLVTVLVVVFGGLVAASVLTVVWSGYRQSRAILLETVLDTYEVGLAMIASEVELGLGPVELSRRLEKTSTEWSIHTFVLEGDRVRAHSKIANGLVQVGNGDELPLIAALGDPVLDAYLEVRDQPVPVAIGFRGIADIRILTLDGVPYAVAINDEGIGFYIPMPSALEYVDHLRAVALNGILLVGAAMLLAGLLAWWLTRPLARLGESARKVAEFDLDRVGPSPRSRVAEVDELGEAFDRMVSGLRWFESYVPKSLVRRLLESGGGKEIPSDERELTVMFTDLAGFTTLSETLSASEVAGLLNDHFEIVAQCIEASGGTLDKFIGDAAMAFWGAPEAQADHAARAIDAALAIRAAVIQDNRRRAAAGRTTLQMRVGIHTGRVVVGNIGAPGRVNYTIVGDTVNVASRLESAGKELVEASDVRMVISESTVTAAGIGARVVPLGRQPVRGRSEPLRLYTLAPDENESN